jgi:hypothetical protein
VSVDPVEPNKFFLGGRTSIKVGDQSLPGAAESLFSKPEPVFVQPGEKISVVSDRTYLDLGPALPESKKQDPDDADIESGSIEIVHMGDPELELPDKQFPPRGDLSIDVDSSNASATVIVADTTFLTGSR